MNELYAELDRLVEEWFHSHTPMTYSIAQNTVIDTAVRMGIHINSLQLPIIASDYKWKCKRMLHLL